MYVWHILRPSYRVTAGWGLSLYTTLYGQILSAMVSNLSIRQRWSTVVGVRDPEVSFMSWYTRGIIRSLPASWNTMVSVLSPGQLNHKPPVAKGRLSLGKFNCQMTDFQTQVILFWKVINSSFHFTLQICKWKCSVVVAHWEKFAHSLYGSAIWNTHTHTHTDRAHRVAHSSLCCVFHASLCTILFHFLVSYLPWMERTSLCLWLSSLYRTL